MKKFAKIFSFGAFASLSMAYAFPNKFFTLDDVAEGIQIDKETDTIAHDVERLRIFSITPQKDLANEIAYHLNTTLGKLRVHKKYEGSESHIDILESVRTKRVYLICSFDKSRWSFNETLIDLLLTICAMKKSSVRKVNVVLPYYAYTRQNKIEGEGKSQSLFASDLASMLEAAGADRIFTVDLESSQLHGAFNIPLVEVDCNRLCARYFKDYNFRDLIVVCANDSLFPRAVKIKNRLQQEGRNVDIGVMVRVQGQNFDYIGKSVAGRDVLLIDNVIDTAQTVSSVSGKLDNLGANNIYLFAIHGILSQNAVQLIDESPIKEVVLTNTVPLDTSNLSSKINQISVGKILAETIAQSTFNKDLETLRKEKII